MISVNEHLLSNILFLLKGAEDCDRLTHTVISMVCTGTKTNLTIFAWRFGGLQAPMLGSNVNAHLMNSIKRLTLPPMYVYIGQGSAWIESEDEKGLLVAIGVIRNCQCNSLVQKPSHYSLALLHIYRRVKFSRPAISQDVVSSRI